MKLRKLSLSIAYEIQIALRRHEDMKTICCAVNALGNLQVTDGNIKVSMKKINITKLLYIWQ